MLPRIFLFSTGRRMSEKIITVFGKNLQAWNVTSSGGKKQVSLTASSKIDEDPFSPDGGNQITQFLQEINGSEKRKPEGPSRVWEILSRLKIKRLEEILSKINEAARKGPSATLLIFGIDLFIRKIELPFDDVQKARLAAPSVVSSTLPFEGGVLLDLIPLKTEMESGRFLAVCVRREEVDHFEQVFKNAEFALYRVVPGFILLLPAVEKLDNDGGEGIYLDGVIGAKAGNDWQESGAVRIMPLPLIEAEVKGREKQPDVFIDVSGTKENQPQQPGPGTRKIDETILGDWLGHPVLSVFNLISSRITEYRAASEKMARKVLFTASAVLLVLSLILCIEGSKHFNRKKANSIKNVMSKEFAEIMKGAAMVDPVAQIKDRISSMEEELALFPREDTPLFSLLFSLSRTLKSSDGITIREINYVRGKLTISGEANNQESVTSFKIRLSEEGGKTVEITETGPAATEGRVKFKFSVT